MNLNLDSRDRLPDALRILLAEYPRNLWETDPGFNDLIRFWLSRHLMFRRVVADMHNDARQMLDGTIPMARYTIRLSRFGGMFVSGLHEHHTIEDTYYFPKLESLDPRISKGFAILDRDHQEIDVHLNAFVGYANEILQARNDAAKLHNFVGKFEIALGEMNNLLDRHLTDEEDLVVPVILKFGSPELE